MTKFISWTQRHCERNMRQSRWRQTLFSCQYASDHLWIRGPRIAWASSGYTLANRFIFKLVSYKAPLLWAKPNVHRVDDSIGINTFVVAANMFLWIVFLQDEWRAIHLVRKKSDLQWLQRSHVLYVLAHRCKLTLPSSDALKAASVQELKRTEVLCKPLDVPGQVPSSE